MSSEAITRNDLTAILNEVLPIAGGEVYTAAWIANTSTTGTHLTDSMNLPAGVYIVTINTPIMSSGVLVSLSSGAPPYYALDGHGEATQLLVLPSPQSIYLQSSSSASITYSYIERGGIKAVRVSGLPFTSQADTIVEQGTSGIWTYRKWASGMYEAWAQSYESFAMTNALGNTYYGNKNIDISSLGFVSIANCQVTGQAGGAYFGTKIEGLSTTNIQLSARASGSQTAYIMHHIQLVGKWK